MLRVWETKTAKGGSGYEPIEKCKTENGERCLHDAALSLDFPHLQAEVLLTDYATRYPDANP